MKFPQKDPKEHRCSRPGNSKLEKPKNSEMPELEKGNDWGTVPGVKRSEKISKGN